MNRTALLLAILLTGCASEPQVVQEELPILALPEKPVFDCSEIKWYYINEKLALDVADFKLLATLLYSDEALFTNCLSST